MKPLDGAYSNWTGAPMTLDDVLATAKKLDALPKIENDITVAPDVKSAMDRSPELRALDGDRQSPVSHPVRVWVDETLAHGLWHTGIPFSERIRRMVR